jgi:hypothetical protein
MANFIEAAVEGKLPASISMHQGDVLSVPATGGRLIKGGEVLELLGPFYPAFLNAVGELIAPSGSPNQLLFLARKPGMATIEVISESALQRRVFEVTVT